MAISRLTRGLLATRPTRSTLFECRVCGTSQFAAMRSCPSCESTDIVEFSLPG